MIDRPIVIPFLTTLARGDWSRACIICGGPIRAGQEVTKSVTKPAHVDCLLQTVEDVQNGREAPPTLLHISHPSSATVRRLLAEGRERQAQAQRARRIETLRAIVDFTEAHGYPPTLGELALALGLVKSTVRYRLEHYCTQGYVVFEARRARTIRLTERGGEIVNAKNVDRGHENDFRLEDRG